MSLSNTSARKLSVLPLLITSVLKTPFNQRPKCNSFRTSRSPTSGSTLARASPTNRNGTCTHDATTKFGLTYAYGAAPNNNGQIASITDYVDNGRSIAYTFDPLYRLSTAVTTGSANYAKWGLSWTYDRYGNSSKQTPTAGSPPYYSVSVSASTNQITGSPYAYDPSGNMTNDGNNTLVYDAENRAVSATNGSTSGSYTYDGNGLRVTKVSGGATTVYIFSGRKVIAEYDNGATPSSPSREYIYGGTALLAKIDSSGTKYYHHDHLSNRLITDSSGNTLAELGHYPFGESWYNATNDKLLFTSYERDSESGNDYAMARYHVNRLSRFSSPDPLSGSASDPQSLNHYPYVQNDPVNFADPLGLYLTGPVCRLANGNPCGSDGGGGWSEADILDFAFTQTGSMDWGVWGPEPGEYAEVSIPIYGNLGALDLIQAPDLGPPSWLANLPNPLLAGPMPQPPCPVNAQTLDAYLTRQGSLTHGGTRRRATQRWEQI